MVDPTLRLRQTVIEDKTAFAQRMFKPSLGAQASNNGGEVGEVRPQKGRKRGGKGACPVGRFPLFSRFKPKPHLSSPSSLPLKRRRQGS